MLNIYGMREVMRLIIEDVRISDDGTAGSVLAGDRLRDAQAAGEKLHLPHFVTCPDRKKWRR
jgi:hypothetical protein